jgi:microcystin-dependent protein
MSDPFLGEIQLYAFQFAPASWAFCAGQIMPIQQNSALFSLLGAIYGGDGKVSFGLPNFQSSAACAQGAGPGLTERVIGETFGSETVTLLTTEMPAHSHAANFYGQRDSTKRQGVPASGSALVSPNNSMIFAQTSTVSGNFPVNELTPTPGGQPHPNQQPYLAMNFCIALSGVFPARP